MFIVNKSSDDKAVRRADGGKEEGEKTFDDDKHFNEFYLLSLRFGGTY